jgi:4-diphosphocytidyl-2-C-methyl-D-erythritol kinase
MKIHPNAKINIGLNVLRKRADNYHDIETVFYPIGLCDSLALEPSAKFNLAVEGIEIESCSDDNLVAKAYQLMKLKYNLPSVSMHLKKNIPIGAGLGGGSADAAFALMELNRVFSIGLDNVHLIELASQLGSDCAFFVLNNPCFASGRGEVLEPVSFSLKGYHLVLVKPEVFVSTAHAYAGVSPAIPAQSLKELIELPVEEWKDYIHNDFEKSVFRSFPEIEKVKQALYSNGAVYASMSGSGSSVFGLFREIPMGIEKQFNNSFCWIGECGV